MVQNDVEVLVQSGQLRVWPPRSPICRHATWLFTSVQPVPQTADHTVAGLCIVPPRTTLRSRNPRYGFSAASMAVMRGCMSFKIPSASGDPSGDAVGEPVAGACVGGAVGALLDGAAVGAKVSPS